MWEYLSAEVPLGDLDAHMNKYGKEGWEAFHVDWNHRAAHVRVLFKQFHWKCTPTNSPSAQ